MHDIESTVTAQSSCRLTALSSLFPYSWSQYVLHLPYRVPIRGSGYLRRSCAHVFDGSVVVSSTKFLHPFLKCVNVWAPTGQTACLLVF